MGSFPPKPNSGIYPGFFPPKGSSPTDICAFRDRQITPFSLVRVRQMQRVSVATLYTQGEQDIELDRGSLVANTRGYTFRSRNLRPGLPASDNNKISAPVEVEVASILKRQWIPKIPPSSPDPRVAAAAQVSEAVLLYNLEAGGWGQVRYENAWNFVVTGTSYLVSYLDEVYTELQPVGSPTAVYCTECKSPFHSPDIPQEAASSLSYGSDRLAPAPPRELGGQVVPEENPYLRMQVCPDCGGELSKNLEGFEANEEMQDFLGRPILIQAPVGRVGFEADTPYEIYLENQGLRLSPKNLRRWFRRKVRSLDWLEDHFPNAVDEYHIMPTPARQLLHENPHVGTWGNIRNLEARYDGNTFDHHVNVDEGVELPTVRNPTGRYVLCVNDQVLMDDDLLISSDIQGQKVYAPRIQLSMARFRLRAGEAMGAGLPDGVISKQNRYNTIMRQLAFTRGTMGAPMVMVPDGMEIKGPEMLAGYGSRLFRFTADPTVDPTSKLAAPTIWEGAVFPTESYRELEVLDKDIKEEVGPQEIDYGAAPKNITTTSGLQILGENSQTRRNPREDEYYGSLERMWSHIQQIEWVHRSEPAMYEVAGPNNTWAVKQYSRLSLCGLTKIKAEKSAFAEKSIVRREAMREAKVDGLLDITSPIVRRKMLEGYGLQADLNEDSTLQMDRAEQIWVDFIDKGVVPTIDETLDNHTIRWMIYGIHLQMNEGSDLMKACRWDETLRVIAGWEDDVMGMLGVELEQAAIYGERITSEEQGAEAFALKTAEFQQQKASYDAESKKGASLMEKGMTPPPSTALPPTPPPQPVVLPILMQDKIISVWQNKLQQNPELLQFLMGPAVPFGETEVLPSKWLEFRCMVESHRILQEIPRPVPPGSGQTMIPGDKGGAGAPGAPAGQPPVGPGQAPQVPSLPEGGRTTGRLS